MDSTWANGNLLTMHNDRSQAADSMLVAAARSGDRVAFDQLICRHSRRVLSQIYRITGNWQDAEDVLQDSLLRAFTRLDTFEFKASFSTWLTRIAINTALMLLRRRRTHVETSFSSTGDDTAASDRWHPVDKGETPEQHCARRQRAYMVRAAVLRMKSGTREVLELQQKTDLSVKEIAQSLGISESAAKSRLTRARVELRALVQSASRRSRSLDVI